MSLLLVTHLGSESSDEQWPVSIDPATYRLSCPCPGWTRRRHLGVCPAMAGGKCSDACRREVKELRTERTCRHVRAVAEAVMQAGGASTVVAMLRRGARLDSTPPQRQRAIASVLTERQRQVADAVARWQRDGCSRVLISRDGTAVAPSRARTLHGIMPDVVYFRADGWSLGAPWALSTVAWEQWRNEWIAAIDLRRPEAVFPFSQQQPATASRAPRVQTCTQPGCKNPRATVRIAGKAVAMDYCQRHLLDDMGVAAVAPKAVAVATDPEVPDWLGGRRAIIIRG